MSKKERNGDRPSRRRSAIEIAVRDLEAVS